MLPMALLDEFPFLGEFSYLKMVATMIMKEFNNNRLLSGNNIIAEGPIISEYQNILYARKASENTSSGKMLHFINAYNLLNKHSMNGYPCGLHCDYYHKGCEAFENKILIINEEIKTSIGRGGSLTGGKYVFAILDWGGSIKNTKTLVCFTTSNTSK